MYYFGCYKEAGHYLWRAYQDGSITKMYEHNTEFPKDFPIQYRALDSCLLGYTKQIEGKGTLNYINGWTILAFWDRSQDKRFNSNSAFMIQGNYSLDKMKELAKAYFPQIYKRFNFDITLF